MSRHLRYWAKTTPEGYHPVLYHCLDVAAAARILLERRPRALARISAVSGLSAETLLSFIPFLLSLHDLGKLADGFQCQVRELMERLQQELRGGEYDRELFRHDSVGYVILSQRLGLLLPELSEDFQEVFASTWLSGAMGHHGRPPVIENSKYSLVKRQFPPDVARDLDDALGELRQLFLPGGLRLPEDLDLDQWEDRCLQVSWLFAGLAVLADWIGSNREYFPASSQAFTARDYYETRALPAARKAIDAAGLAEQPLSSVKSFGELWPGFTPTPLQELAADLPLAAGPQLIVIEEVTGGGKTEAAFVLAHRLVAAEEADGLYFGLPTMATANAMYDRIAACWRELYAAEAEPSLILAHAKRHLRLDHLADAAHSEGRQEAGSALRQCAEWLADSRKKALLAEVGVGTIDQALLAVLKARHQSLRLWGLAGKVLIVDEVHAADDYMQRLLAGLLEIHAAFGGSAILLSATLPNHQRAALAAAFAKGSGARTVAWEMPANVAYPSLSHLAGGRARVHPVAARPSASRTLGIGLLHEEAEVERVLLETLDAGGCACWIRNTVGDAIAAYRRWSALLGEERVGLFHARFTVADRHHIERDVLDRFGKKGGHAERAGRLLIATQVVEQSLDLDFDTLISDLAPADLLVQRAGRLRRHARDVRGDRVEGPDQRGEAIFHIFTPPPSPEAPSNWVSSFLSGAAVVYPDHGKLWVGAHWLAARGKLRIPEDLPDLIEAVYSPDSELLPPASLLPRTDRADGKARADRSIADNNRLRFEQGYVPDGLMSDWRDDVATPTRLGDPTVVLRLCREVAGKPEPFHPGESGWEMSEVSLRQARVAAEAERDAAFAARARLDMRDGGRWKVLVLMRPRGDGYAGWATGPSGDPVEVLYSSRMGLEIHR